MEPGLALRSVESALRNIVRELMGAQWLRSLRPDQIQRLEEKRAQDQKQRHGTTVHDDLLEYTETTQLTRIIQKNWDTFRPVFKNKKRADVTFEALNAYRLPAAHSRDLRPFEVDLLSGISGQLRGMITEYLNANQQDSIYYPRIESVVTSDGHSGITNYMDAMGRERLIRRLGDVETFTCSGWDPESRDIQWGFRVDDAMPGRVTNMPADMTDATGTNVTLSFEFRPTHVRSLALTVLMKSTGPFHRYVDDMRMHEGVDDYRVFFYTVYPH